MIQMRVRIAPDRVLALDIRRSRFGFVVLEGAERLLDWGICRLTRRSESCYAVMRRRIVRLLDTYDPTFVVSQEVDHFKKILINKSAPVANVVREEAKRHGSMWQTLEARTVRSFFRNHDATNKAEIASTLAEWYPDIAWKLPPKRKPWQSEDYRMSVFDAAALGTAYLALKANELRGRAVVRSDGRVLS